MRGKEVDSKSEINNEAEKTCATGKFAALYGVSVRTVQYYDEKDLLPPSGLTEGGRRIYTEADAAKLRRIMVLKSLGLKLADNDDTQGHLHALRYKGLVRRSLERKATSLIGDRNARRAACHQANSPL